MDNAFFVHVDIIFNPIIVFLFLNTVLIQICSETAYLVTLDQLYKEEFASPTVIALLTASHMIQQIRFVYSVWMATLSAQK
jgi:hypothetical protein